MSDSEKPKRTADLFTQEEWMGMWEVANDHRNALQALVQPARELLYLYDWRPALAKREKDHASQIGFEDGDEAAWRAEGKELKRLLREYGERKKAGWIALRAALDGLEVKPPENESC